MSNRISIFTKDAPQQMRAIDFDSLVITKDSIIINPDSIEPASPLNYSLDNVRRFVISVEGKKVADILFNQ